MTVRPLVFALFPLLCLDSYEGMDRQVELHRIASRGIGLPVTGCMPTLTWSGRSMSDMPFGQDGYVPQEVRRIQGGYEKGSNQVASV